MKIALARLHPRFILSLAAVIALADGRSRAGRQRDHALQLQRDQRRGQRRRGQSLRRAGPGSDGLLYGTIYTAAPTATAPCSSSPRRACSPFCTTSATTVRNHCVQLVQGNDGTFYGTTYSGGSPSGNSDTVFSVTSTGTYTVLYSFTGVGNDGVNLEGSLILGSDGNFYGVTANGGTNDNGTVFKLSLTGGAGTLQFATLSINATET